MRIFTLLSLLLLSIGASFAQPTINFETGGAGANYTWTVFENDTPPLEVVANPSATGINTSEKVAKMRILQTNAPYAGVVTKSFTPFTLNASNSIVKIMVYKNVISDVGIKFEANFASTGEIKVANTKINQWEELTFDFSGKIGEASSTNIDGLVIFPDFTSTRAGETIAYFDNITFSASSTTPTQPSLPLDFESSTITYTFSDFEGAVTTVIDNPQKNTINTSNKVGKLVKNAGQVYAGTVIPLGAPIDFSTNKTFKVKVFMPKVGAKLLLKVENQTNPGINFEKEVTGTVANAWEELTFDYSAINTANTYQKIILIFDNGTMGDGTANFTYLFDDILLTTGGGTAPTGPTLPLDFESSTITYTFSDFEGAVTTVIDNPQKNTINTSNKVGKMVKNAGQVYAGTVIPLAAPIDFSTNKTFKVKVFMPRAGAKLLLKVENQSNPGINFEKEVIGTVANAWEELTFDYSAINTANTYQKIILIFDNGTMGDGTANFTYLFDDILLTTGGGTAPTGPTLPLDFESSTITYTFSDFEGAVTTVIDNPQKNTINTSNKVGKMVKNAGQVYAGTVIPLASPIDFSTNKTFKVKVFMPKVGAKLLLKVENQSDAGINFEKEATGTVANAWEELTFDYSAINTANTYQKIILIFDLGLMGDGSANFTYLFDDIQLTTGGGPAPTLPSLPLDFESSTITYTFSDFEGAVTTVIDNPQKNTINTSNKVGKMVKNAGQVYAGSLIALAAPIDFSTNKTFKVKVFMPRAGAKLLLKVENQSNPGINFEKEATGTVANAWEELTFDYSTINTANAYQKIILIFDNGTMGDGTANFTYLFDDIRLTTATTAGSQTITFPAIPTKTVGDPAFTLTATASSNLPVTYSTDSDKITISGSTVTIVKAGRATIKANQAGNDVFSPAPEVTQSFCIKPAKPVVTVTGLNTETITLTSSATTGNAWFLNGTAIPSATGSTLSVTAPGIYKVNVTVDDCVSDFSAEVPLIVTGDLTKYGNSINVYPNPVVNYIELVGMKGTLSNVQLYDLAGRLNTIQFEKYGETHQANVQHLTPGIYLLQVQDGAELYRFKVIKK